MNSNVEGHVPWCHREGESDQNLQSPQSKASVLIHPWRALQKDTKDHSLGIPVRKSGKSAIPIQDPCVQALSSVPCKCKDVHSFPFINQNLA